MNNVARGIRSHGALWCAALLLVFGGLPIAHAATTCTPVLRVSTVVTGTQSKSSISGTGGNCTIGDTAIVGIPSQLTIANGTPVVLGAMSGSVTDGSLALTMTTSGPIAGSVPGQVASPAPTTLIWTLNGAPLAADTVATAAGGPTWFSKWTKVNTASTTLSGIVSPVLPQDGIQFTMKDQLGSGQACKAVNIFVYSPNGVGTWAGRGRCSSDGKSAEASPTDFLTWSAGRKDPHAGSYIVWLVEASITDRSVSSYSDEATISSSYYPTTTVSASAKPAVTTQPIAPSPQLPAQKFTAKTAFQLETFDGDLVNGDRDTPDRAKTVTLQSDQTVRVQITNTGDDAIQLVSLTSRLTDGRGIVLRPQIDCTPSVRGATLAPRTTLLCEVAFASPDEAGDFILSTIVEARSIESGTVYHATDAWHGRSETVVASLTRDLGSNVAAVFTQQGKPNLLLVLIAGLCTSGIVAALLLLGYYRRRRHQHHPRRWHAYRPHISRSGLRINRRRSPAKG